MKNTEGDRKTMTMKTYWAIEKKNGGFVSLDTIEGLTPMLSTTKNSLEVYKDIGETIIKVRIVKVLNAKNF